MMLLLQGNSLNTTRYNRAVAGSYMSMGKGSLVYAEGTYTNIAPVFTGGIGHFSDYFNYYLGTNFSEQEANLLFMTLFQQIP